jgi:folate-binding protein YgfZ
MSFTEANIAPRPLTTEYAALREGAGFRLLEARTIIRVTGDDRVSFFHGICSADVKGAHSGDVLPALFLNEHAHVIGDFFIYVEDDALMLEADASAWSREQAHLEKLLVADDVEMDQLDAFGVLHVEGPRAGEMLSAVAITGADALMPWRCSKSGNIVLARLARFGADGFSVLAARAALGEVADRLAREGAVPVSMAALDIVRVEHGIAQIGLDTGEKTIALEALLQRSISFSKGCYLGQETIERATSRGGLKKKMFGLRFDAPVAAGSELFLDDKEVGRVSSAVMSPRLGAIGLAILHHSAWTPGTGVLARDANGDITTVVIELPFDK